MTNVKVTPEVLEGFAATNAAMATAVGTAGSIASASRTSASRRVASSSSAARS